MHINAAKHGQVWITVSENLKWKPKHELTPEDYPEDKCSLLGIPGVPQRERRKLPLEKMPDVVGVAGDFRMRRVSADALTPADVDEDTLEEPEFLRLGTGGDGAVCHRGDRTSRRGRR